MKVVAIELLHEVGHIASVDEEFPEYNFGSRHTGHREHCVDCVLDLLAERSSIVDDVKLVVANVALTQGVIRDHGLINIFEPSLIIIVVKFFSAIGRRHHVYDGIVSVVAQLNLCPSCFLEDAFEHFRA